MNVFPDSLHIEDAGMIGESRVFRLTERFRYLSSLGCVTVPKGTLTDGASIPRCFWSMGLAPFDQWFCCAVVHDHLYSANNTEFTRDEADFIFSESMWNLKVPFLKRHAIVTAVRLFGRGSFKGKPSYP
jgi:hypothetical protein